MPIYPPNNPKKPKLRKNEKNAWRYYLFTQVYHKWQSYDILWFPRYWVQRTEFFVILDHFLLFYLPNNPKNQNFEKKKTPGDIILHMCTINDHHMMYSSWDMKCDGRHTYFFVILDCFLPFYPSNNPKNQNFEKLKKTPEDIIILHKCTTSHDHYAILFLRYGM